MLTSSETASSEATIARLEPASGELLGRNFVAHVCETFGARALLTILSLATTMIVARVLGPEGRGLYAVAMAISTLGVQFSTLGLHASNTYFVARQPRLLPKMVANSVAISAVLGGGIAVAAGLFFVMLPTAAPVNGLLLWLSLLAIPIGLCYLLLQNLLLGTHQIRAYNKIEIGTKVAAFVLLVSLWLGHAAGLLAFVVLAIAGTAAAATWAWKALASQLTERAIPSRHLLRDHIGYGIKAYAAAILSFIVLRIDLLMVKYMAGAEQAGFYSIAVAMGDALYLAPVVVGTLLFPRLSAMENGRERMRFMKRVAFVTAGGMALFLSVAGLVAPFMVKLLFGVSYLPSVPSFLWLLPAILALSLNTIFMNYFASDGMPWITVYSPAAAALVNIGLNLVFISKRGIVGASQASVVAYCLMLFMSIVYIAKTGAPRAGHV